MIYLKLRQAGQCVNHKPVERLCGLEKLQIKRRRRKKIPMCERQPLIRPGAPNEVWSMDFVFDRVAGGRAIKCLAIVDDATHECLAMVAENNIGGMHLTRIMDQMCSLRGRPAVIRTDRRHPLRYVLEVGGCKPRHGPRPDPREDICFQTPDDVNAVWRNA